MTVGPTGPDADTITAGGMGNDLAMRRLHTPPQIRILISTRALMTAHCLWVIATLPIHFV